MPYLSPPTLTHSEVASLLSVTRHHARDHLILSLALGTGLRLAEIVGLDVGDVYLPEGTPRVRVRLRPQIAKGGRAGDVFLPDALLPKLRRFRRYKAGRGETLEPDAPLLCSQSRWRISKRRVQVAFRAWQVAAGFDRLYGFHALRHYAEPGISGTPPSPQCTALSAISSWPSGSRGTRVRSRPSPIPIPVTKSCARRSGGSVTDGYRTPDVIS